MENRRVQLSTGEEHSRAQRFYRFRWGEKGKWNTEPVAAGVETELSLSLVSMMTWRVSPSPFLFCGVRRLKRACGACDDFPPVKRSSGGR